MDLESVVRDLAPRVLAYCLLQTGDSGLAEEVSQDALTALVRRWRGLGPPESPAAFVFAISRRRCARAAVRRRLWLPIEGALGLRDRRRDPEQRSIASSDRRRMVHLLARLRSADRHLLVMLTVGEMEVADAARSLGLSISAAKMRAMRARRRLRTWLESGNGNDPRRS